VDSTRHSVIGVSGPETDTAMPEERPAIGTATHRTPCSCSCSSMGESGRSNPLEFRVEPNATSDGVLGTAGQAAPVK
jgi:hypothetical protein